jgi:hypothetical protein
MSRMPVVGGFNGCCTRIEGVACDLNLHVLVTVWFVLYCRCGASLFSFRRGLYHDFLQQWGTLLYAYAYCRALPYYHHEVCFWFGMGRFLE